MAGSHELLDAVKLQLKTRNKKYKDLAEGLGVSEASIKRMFSTRNCDLERLDKICAWLGIEFAELTRGIKLEEKLTTQLTLAQEKEIVSDRKLLLMAICVMNHLTVGEIMEEFSISIHECTQLLVKLDRIKFIDLLPNNAYRLKVARSFRWLPDGPMHRYFRSMAAEFCDHPFTGKEECFLQLNLMLSPASIDALKRRIHLVAQDYAEQHNQDARTSRENRQSVTILIGMRPWVPKFVAAMERAKK